MSENLTPSPELVEAAAPYFTANPDVDYLVAVVAKGEFYRPEREQLAEHEALVNNTQAVRVYREVPGSDTSDSDADNSDNGADNSDSDAEGSDTSDNGAANAGAAKPGKAPKKKATTKKAKAA